MTKKTIISVLIALLILNTFFWFNLVVQRIPRVYCDTDLTKLFLTGKETGKIVKRSYMERLSIALGKWESSKGAITLLIITDAVLVAISFMVILLYKKD